MPQERNRDAEQLLARAADRTRSARAELSAASVDLFLPAELRLTDQQRALMGDILAKLVGAIELELRQNLGEALRRVAPDVAAGLDAETAVVAYDLLAKAGRLRGSALLRCVMQRAEEHRLALVTADAAGDASADAGLLEALARSPDPELARRAVAYVVIEARRRDRFREPVLLREDLPGPVAIALYWDVAAALRRHLLGRFVVEPSGLDRAAEDAVRRALADHGEGQGGYGRAARLAARLGDLGELGDDFLVRALAQGHLALFAGALAARGSVGIDAVWRAIADRGRHSLLVLLRAVEMETAAAGAIIELLEAGQPLARTPAAQRALLAAYEALELAEAQRLLRGWQLDPGYRHAIDELDAGSS